MGFDTLRCSKTLQEAGIPQAQAEAFATAQKAAFDEVLTAKELATQADILRLENKMEVNKQELESRIKEQELRLLKWQIGIGFALAVIMAKGFGWLGF